MFEKFKHQRNPGLCLDNMVWRGNYIECAVCDGVVAVQFDGNLSVLDRYINHEDKIHAYARTIPNPNYKKQPDAWSSFEKDIKAIRKEANSVRKSNEQRRIDHPDWFDAEGDAIEVDAYDGEDSAAGGFYLGNDTSDNPGESIE
jgi:hypothetical protein